MRQSAPWSTIGYITADARVEGDGINGCGEQEANELGALWDATELFMGVQITKGSTIQGTTYRLC